MGFQVFLEQGFEEVFVGGEVRELPDVADEGVVGLLFGFDRQLEVGDFEVSFDFFLLLLEVADHLRGLVVVVVVRGEQQVFVRIVSGVLDQPVVLPFDELLPDVVDLWRRRLGLL